MLDKKIYDFYDSIEPSEALTERTVAMTKATNKTVRLSRRAIALITAAVILAISVTGFAAAKHIFGDNSKGIVQENGIEAFELDFTKADTIPEFYSNPENEIIKQFLKVGYKNVLLPDVMLNGGFKVDRVPYKAGTLAMIPFTDYQSFRIDLFIIPSLDKNEMKDALSIGGGDDAETKECYVTRYAGMDVQLSYTGTKDNGYQGYITYAVGDTIYMIQPEPKANLDDEKHLCEEIAMTLNNQQ